MVSSGTVYSGISTNLHQLRSWTFPFLSPFVYSPALTHRDSSHFKYHVVLLFYPFCHPAWINEITFIFLSENIIKIWLKIENLLKRICSSWILKCFYSGITTSISQHMSLVWGFFMLKTWSLITVSFTYKQPPSLCSSVLPLQELLLRSKLW